MLARGGVDVAGQRLPYLLMHAELDALICSGPRRGAQHTYMLLDERAPACRRPAARGGAGASRRCGTSAVTGRPPSRTWRRGRASRWPRCAGPWTPPPAGWSREDVDGTVYWSGAEPAPAGAGRADPEVRLDPHVRRVHHGVRGVAALAHGVGAGAAGAVDAAGPAGRARGGLVAADPGPGRRSSRSAAPRRSMRRSDRGARGGGRPVRGVPRARRPPARESDWRGVGGE